MKLNFILGKAQNDNKAQLLQRLAVQAARYPKDQFIWLVPNHIAFEMEVSVLQSLQQQPGYFATNQIQVLSFSRLAWFYLREQPIYQQPRLTSTTQAMILARIVRDQSKQLRLYAGEAQRAGFITTLQEQIQQLLQNQITPTDLMQWQQQVQTQGDLKWKLADLQLIYQAYLTQVQGRYSDDNQLWQALDQYLSHDPHQTTTHYFVSDFAYFEVAEQKLLATMIRHSAEVQISLTLDHPYDKNQESIFFHRPRQVWQKLTQSARQAQVPVTNEVTQSLRVCPSLAMVDDFWIQQNTNLQQLTPVNLPDPQAVQIWVATSPQAEVAAVSTYIRQLVATQNYRYQDFLVLARNLTDYQQFLEPYFTNQGISYFLDLQHSMQSHAFKDLLDSLFDLYQNNLQYSDVFRLLKTELIVPANWPLTAYREAVDLCDNYVLAHGLRAADWLQEADFPNDSTSQTIQKQMAQINRIKHLIMAIYQEVQQIVTTQLNCQQACTKLYQLLEEFQVFANLKNWEQQAVKAGDIALSQQPQQIVNTFVAILDDYVTIFETAPFVVDEFRTVMDTGFENANYSTIPSVLDSVQISGLSAIHNNNRRITLIMGANDVDMPLQNHQDRLLTDDDLQTLQTIIAEDVTLPQTSQDINSAEPYLHELAFLSGTERLIFTYATNKNDSVVQMSPYVKLLQEHFQIPVRSLNAANVTTEDEILHFVGSPIITANQVVAIYRQAQERGQTVAAPWQQLRTLLNQLPTHQTQLQKIWSALDYHNQPQPLQPQIARALYGDQLIVSISQLESFYQNPYEYFLHYGLNLKPRPEFKITPANQGTFYHEVLDETIKNLQQQQLSLNQLNEAQLAVVAHQVIQQVLQQKSFQVFSYDEKFARQRLIQTIQRSLEAIRRQTQLVPFYPFKTEVAFGQVGALHNIRPLTYQLNDHQSVVIRGRIDRIDRLTQYPDNYFVVDYKSGAHDFKYSDFYAGLDLQMMTYLASLLNDPSLMGEAAMPIGGFYFQLQDPIVKFEDLKGQPQTAHQKLFKQYSYKGLVIDKGQTGAQLAPDAQQASLIFPVNKNQRLKPNKTVSYAEFQLMLAYNRYLIMLAAEKILAGEISLSPVRLDKQRTTLQYSDYLPIMRFDAMLAENNYRLVRPLSKKDFLKRINQKLKEAGYADKI